MAIPSARKEKGSDIVMKHYNGRGNSLEYFSASPPLFLCAPGAEGNHRRCFVSWFIASLVVPLYAFFIGGMAYGAGPRLPSALRIYNKHRAAKSAPRHEESRDDPIISA